MSLACGLLISQWMRCHSNCQYTLWNPMHLIPMQCSFHQTTSVRAKEKQSTNLSYLWTCVSLYVKVVFKSFRNCEHVWRERSISIFNLPTLQQTIQRHRHHHHHWKDKVSCCVPLKSSHFINAGFITYSRQYNATLFLTLSLYFPEHPYGHICWCWKNRTQV